MMSIQVMKQALEALNKYAYYDTNKGYRCAACNTLHINTHLDNCQLNMAFENLRAAIEQMEKAEPVAWVSDCKTATFWREVTPGTRLYTHPTPVPDGMVLVGWLDGRTRFFCVDDPMFKNSHDGMREVYAASQAREQVLRDGLIKVATAWLSRHAYDRLLVNGILESTSSDNTALREYGAKLLEEMAESFRITTGGHSIRHNEDGARFLDIKAAELRSGKK